MQPTTETDYKQLFSQLIQKQILILGPDITIAKVKNVPGIVVDQAGSVQSITGDPQALLQALINQFVELSGMIVKQTMESIVASNPGMRGLAASTAFGGAPLGPITTQQVVQPVRPDEAPAESVVADALVPSPASSPVHSEPPSIAEIGLHATDLPVDSKPVQETATMPSSKEMHDLNKALEDLASSPAVKDVNPPVIAAH